MVGTHAGGEQTLPSVLGQLGQGEPGSGCTYQCQHAPRLPSSYANKDTFTHASSNFECHPGWLVKCIPETFLIKNS